MDNPWTKIKSNLIYENAWIRVYQDDVILPDEKEGSYGLVKTKGGVGVVAINNEGELYLVGQYRYAPDVYSLEIPKGAFDSFDSTESPVDAAKRELKEETGIIADTWIQLGTVHTLMGYSNDIVHLFLATDLSFGQSSPGTNECISTFTVPFHEIGTIIREGFIIDGKKIKITDATSIVAIFLAKDLMEKD
jgi:8-oxo-dGTP pyrophosphatase MutT (NUDIX family)